MKGVWGETQSANEGYRVSSWGDENVRRLKCGVGCTTVNMLKNTDLNTLLGG